MEDGKNDNYHGNDSWSKEDSYGELLLLGKDLGEDLGEDLDEDSDDDLIKIVQIVPASRKPTASKKRTATSRKRLAKPAATKPKEKCTRKARVSGSSGSRPSTPQTKKRVVAEVSALVLVQAHPPSMKPRDNLLRSCFTSEKAGDGKEKHICTSCLDYVS